MSFLDRISDRFKGKPTNYLFVLPNGTKVEDGNLKKKLEAVKAEPNTEIIELHHSTLVDKRQNGANLRALRTRFLRDVEEKVTAKNIGSIGLINLRRSGDKGTIDPNLALLMLAKQLISKKGKELKNLFLTSVAGGRSFAKAVKENNDLKKLFCNKPQQARAVLDESSLERRDAEVETVNDAIEHIQATILESEDFDSTKAEPLNATVLMPPGVDQDQLTLCNFVDKIARFGQEAKETTK